jgi:hypothetical protein
MCLQQLRWRHLTLYTKRREARKLHCRATNFVMRSTVELCVFTQWAIRLAALQRQQTHAHIRVQAVLCSLNWWEDYKHRPSKTSKESFGICMRRKLHWTEQYILSSSWCTGKLCRVKRQNARKTAPNSRPANTSRSDELFLMDRRTASWQNTSSLYTSHGTLYHIVRVWIPRSLKNNIHGGLFNAVVKQLSKLHILPSARRALSACMLRWVTEWRSKCLEPIKSPIYVN